MDWLWNSLNSLAALGALAIAFATFRRTEDRATKTDARFKESERRELEASIRLAIVPMPRTYFGYPLYTLANEGTAAVKSVAFDSDSLKRVAFEGTSFWSELKPGEISDSEFSFRTTNLDDIPASIRITFRSPFDGDCHSRVPAHPIDVRDRQPRPGE